MTAALEGGDRSAARPSYSCVQHKSDIWKCSSARTILHRTDLAIKNSQNFARIEHFLFRIDIQNKQDNCAERYQCGPRQLCRCSDALRTGRCVDRFLMGVAARFPAPFQTGPGVHPAFCTSSSPGIMRREIGLNHPQLSNAEVKETVELYLYSALCLNGRIQGELT